MESSTRAVIGLVLILLLASTCAKTLTPVAPTAGFRFDVQPRSVFRGGVVRLTCYVPEAMGRGTIRLSLEGMAAHGPSDIQHIQTVLIVEYMECGAWSATCEVMLASGKRFRAQHEVEVHGCSSR